MRRQIPILMAVLTLATARATSLFTDAIPANSNGAPLAWLDRETTAATTLTLSRTPDGDDTIAVIPPGGRVDVLFVDEAGNCLVKTPFGITGWAQARAGADSGETFPALALRHDDRLATDLYYLPELGKPLDNHYYYTEAEPDTPAPGLPPENTADETGPVSEIFDRLLETALAPGGTRYNIDCTVSLSGQHYCLLLPTADKIRRSGVAGLFGQAFYLPGNGHVYSDVDDSSSRYYRARQKWSVQDGAMLETEQPYHYLGLASSYRGQYDPEHGSHDKQIPLHLTDRAGGNKTVAEIAPGAKVTLLLADPHQPCARTAQNGNTCADLWLLLQTTDGTTGWVKINYSKKTPDLEGLHGFANNP